MLVSIPKPLKYAIIYFEIVLCLIWIFVILLPMLRSAAQTMPLITTDSFRNVTDLYYDFTRPLAAPVALDMAERMAITAIDRADQEESPRNFIEPAQRAPLWHMRFGNHPKQFHILTPAQLRDQYRFDADTKRYYRLFRAIPVTRHSIFVNPAHQEFIMQPGQVILQYLSGGIDCCTDRKFLHNCRVNSPVEVDWKKFDRAVESYARNLGMTR